MLRLAALLPLSMNTSHLNNRLAPSLPLLPKSTNHPNNTYVPTKTAFFVPEQSLWKGTTLGFSSCVCVCTDSLGQRVRGGHAGEESGRDHKMFTYLAHDPRHFNAATGNFAQHVAHHLACLVRGVKGQHRAGAE
jgi:hypothetical protein